MSALSPGSLWSTVTIPSTDNCVITSNDSELPASSSQYSFPLDNMIDYTVACPTEGLTIPVTIIFDKQYNTSSWVPLFYNTTSQTYTPIAGATFSTMTIGGIVKTTLTYDVTDGGNYDNNSTADGVIVDPVAIGLSDGSPSISLAKSPDTGYGAPGLKWYDPFIIFDFFASGLVLIIGLRQLYKKSV